MIQKAYQNPTDFTQDFLQAKPFAHIAFSQFFDDKIVEKLIEALQGEEFHYKRSDLFSFYQTDDLKYSKNPFLKDLVSKLYSKEFIDYMQKITGFALSNTVDIAATLYTDTNYLLCHDDELDGRKIAFLLYLSDMQEGDGGELQLFEEENGSPIRIVKKIIPKTNLFTFFEVTPTSFHSIGEVRVKKNRVALGGWYHASK